MRHISHSLLRVRVFESRLGPLPLPLQRLQMRFPARKIALLPLPILFFFSALLIVLRQFAILVAEACWFRERPVGVRLWALSAHLLQLLRGFLGELVLGLLYVVDGTVDEAEVRLIAGGLLCLGDFSFLVLDGLREQTESPTRIRTSCTGCISGKLLLGNGNSHGSTERDTAKHVGLGETEETGCEEVHLQCSGEERQEQELNCRHSVHHELSHLLL